MSIVAVLRMLHSNKLKVMLAVYEENLRIN